jgi:membrane protein DedA with SNARE-associated domain
MTHLIQSWGLILLFLLIAAESSGVPLPGETALITAGVLSSQNKFPAIEWVILVAALAAIIGDNVGYWIARKGGHRLLEKWHWTRRMRDRFLPPSKRFFERHGGKTIFFARFIAVLRVAGAWIAGLSHMQWWKFLFWNAAGGICWAVLVGLISFYLGHAAADAIQKWGLIAGGVAAAIAILLFVGMHYVSKRVVREEE